jgi:hypothetical protein
MVSLSESMSQKAVFSDTVEAGARAMLTDGVKAEALES